MTDGRDTTWAISLLEQYRDALSDLIVEFDNFGPATQSLSTALRLSSSAWTIVSDVLPDIDEYRLDLNEYSHVQGQFTDVNRALGVLELREELEAHWPSEPSVILDTSKLHPWVWIPAKELWDIARYGEALHAAALTVNAQLQDKLKREDDMEFTPLARNAFSMDDPTPGNPRLRFDLDDRWSEEATKDWHTGAATLGESVFRLWRNILSHRPTRLNEQTATEALGALSNFARMVDVATVVRFTPDESVG